jgi:branched-chain amino acid transport system substrate-binding protein
MDESKRSARCKRLSLLGVGLSFVLLAAGCTSKSNDASSSTAGPAFNEADLGSAAPATDSPVTIGTISASQGDSALAANFKKVEAGMQAAVQYVNAYRNGLGGHKVELFICQGQETPAGAQDCANQMVNKGVVAVVEPLTSQGPSIVPILEANHIPFIGVSGASAQELTSKDSFIFSGGLPTFFAAIADYASQHGVKSFDVLVTDGAGVVAGVTAFAKPAFDKKDIKFTATPVAVGTPDLTPQLGTAASSGADAIASLGDATFCASFLQGYKQLGLTQTRYLLGICNDPTVTKAYGDLIKGSVGTNSFSTDPNDPDVKAFAAMAHKFSNGTVDPDIGRSFTEVSGVIPFVTLADLFTTSVATLDASTMFQTVSTTPGFPLFLGGGSTLTCDGKQVPVLSSLCGTSVGVGVLDANAQAVDAPLVDYKGRI